MLDERHKPVCAVAGRELSFQLDEEAFCPLTACQQAVIRKIRRPEVLLRSDPLKYQWEYLGCRPPRIVVIGFSDDTQ